MIKNPFNLRDEGRDEAYIYFDKNIRSLPKNDDGTINLRSSLLHDKDVDAFRHAYTSGVFVQEYKSEWIADVLGQVNELARPNNPVDLKNMDLWNNAVGRKSEFVSQIESNNYLGYYVAIIDGIPTPVSKPDDNPANNLG